jgi:hypothetical protein
MENWPSSGETGGVDVAIYAKLEKAFGELWENIPLVIASLPNDVKVALSSTDEPEIIRKIWCAYLERMTSYLWVPDRDAENTFLAVHGHRYAHRTHVAIT